eukprot:jgi/Galph1/1055/GphlegSOOS_G5820.1
MVDFSSCFAVYWKATDISLGNRRNCLFRNTTKVDKSLRSIARQQSYFKLRIYGTLLEQNTEKLLGRITQWFETDGKTFDARKPENRLMIGITGVPGSGKSTLSTRTAEALNQIYPDACVVVPMDGFHLPKSVLDQMEDPKEAHARRGAPWTFDGKAFVNALKEIRYKGESSLPCFDHRVGDPEQDAIYISKSTPVILVEGNYLLLPEYPWNAIPQLLDDIWFVDCSIKVAMSRVYERMVKLVGMELRQHVSDNTFDVFG